MQGGGTSYEGLREARQIALLRTNVRYRYLITGVKCKNNEEACIHYNSLVGRDTTTSVVRDTRYCNYYVTSLANF